MNKWTRHLGIVCVSLLSLATFTGVAHANSYVDEMMQANEAAKKMNSQSQQQFMNGLTVNQIQNMDIETALMTTQSERVRLLDAQLQAQLDAVQERNQRLSELNAELNAAKVELSTLRTTESESTDQDNSKRIQALEEKVDQLKSSIDNVSNSQQMDMLRLQSLSNKRNEAFDTMTNFVKKMQESRASIIENMR